MKTSQTNKAHHQVNIEVSKDLKKKSKKLSRKIVIHYFKDYKMVWIIALLMAIVATITSSLAILGMSDLTEKLIKLFSGNGTSNSLVNFMIFASVLIIFYIINALFTFSLNFLVVTYSQKIGARMRLDLFSKIQSLSVQYFDTHESGDIMSVLTNDVYNIVLFLSQNFGQLIIGFVSLIGMLLIMFLISPYLSLISLALFPFMIFIIFLISKKSQKTFTLQQKSLGKINGYLEEIISGQNIVNLFNQEKQITNEFNNLNNKLNEYGEKAQSVSGVVLPWNIFMSNVIILTSIILGVYFSISNIGFGSEIFGVAGPGLVTAFLLALRNFNQPITQMMGMIASFQSAIAGTSRVEDIFSLTGEINKDEVIDVKNLTGKIEIKNLNFSYIEGKQILKNVSLSSKPGEMIAIIGPTGSGKSTIINLLTKFYDIKDGDIFLDGYDLKKISKHSIRNEVSIVLQDTYLFSGTIKENIRYAKQNATDAEIVDAAKTADCHNFIMQLDSGYDFMLSENAQELSQGQKQLIAIARALISPSNILILDEATSNIDTKTELVVQQAMFKLIKNKTSFVIAHRLSTIKKANKIIVLGDGEVVEVGNHKELISKKGFYYKMYNSQFNEEN